MKEFRIGVVGYCPPSRFDENEARRMIAEAYDRIDHAYQDMPKAVVSGLSDVGVLSLAYREAVKRRWRTVGISCSKAFEQPCFPVDEQIIVGSEWGDESETFLNYIDALVRIGGGEQSVLETAHAKKTGKVVIEYDLPKLG